MSGAVEAVQKATEAVKDFVDKNSKECAIGAGVATTALVAAYAWRRAANYVPPSGPYTPNTLPTDAYDGASPRGLLGESRGP